MSKDIFDALHAKGRSIAVFGPLLDDPKVQRKLLDWKTDVLFTDRPDIFRETIDDYYKKDDDKKKNTKKEDPSTSDNKDKEKDKDKDKNKDEDNNNNQKDNDILLG